LNYALPFLNFGLSLAMLPILSRGYSAELWGSWSLYFIAGSTTGTLITLRLENVFYSTKKAEVVSRFCSTLLISMYLIHCIAIFATLSIFQFDLQTTAAILSLNTAINTILIAYYLRIGRTTPYAFSVLMLSAIPLCANVLISIFTNFTKLNFFISYITSNMLTAFLAFRIIKMNFRNWSDYTKQCKRLAQRGKHQLRYTLPQTVVNLVRLRSVYLFMGGNISPSHIATYNFTERVSNSVSSSLAQVLRPYYVNHSKAHKGLLDSKLKILLILIIASCLTLTFLLYNNNLLPIVFGEQYNNSDKIWKLMLLQGISAAFFNWGDKAFEIRNKQKLNFNIELSAAILFTLFFLINNKANLFIGWELLSTVIYLQISTYLAWSYFAIKTVWNAKAGASIILIFLVTFFILLSN